MKIFEKLRSLFTHRKQTAKPAATPPQHANTREGADDSSAGSQSPERPGDSSDGEPYGALSEVAAPEPVERLSEAELARHPSLEQRLSGRDRGTDNDEGVYWSLSEIAAPEPVERRSEQEIARHPSLEQRLSYVSHR